MINDQETEVQIIFKLNFYSEDIKATHISHNSAHTVNSYESFTMYNM